MKKENIFDLYAAQHKDEPAPAVERVPGEVTPEDVTPAPEVTPEKKQETKPEPPQDPEPAASEPEKVPEEKEGD